MSKKETMLTPVGRLVQGSLYEPQTTDLEGRPLVIKTGVNQGQPRVDYYFALAVPKAGDTHWQSTEWGTIIWSAGHLGFPGGQADNKSFAWKITDGDSSEPNKAGRRPCDKDGYPGCWVLNFSSSFAPSIYNEDGTVPLLTADHVQLGDFIQVWGSVADNGSLQQPGVFLNHNMIAFYGFGERIVLGADPKLVFNSVLPMPAGASKTPLASSFNPAVSTPAPAPAPAPAAPPPPPPPPHTAILAPPVMPARVMLPAAQGASYEQMIAAGWTDATLQAHGMMRL